MDFFRRRMDVSRWIKLYNTYGHSYSSKEGNRKFCSFAGVSPEVAETIYSKYSTIGKHSALYDRFRLLIVLHFLKTAPTEDLGSTTFKMARNTYRKLLWCAINYLNSVMTEINIEDRYDPFVPSSGIFKNVCIIVDGTECPIDRYVLLFISVLFMLNYLGHLGEYRETNIHVAGIRRILTEGIYTSLS
jgi:hypothetical protein